MEPQTPAALRDQLLALLEAGDTEALTTLLGDLEPFDLAAAFHLIAVPEALRLLELMALEDGAALLLEMEVSGQLQLIESLGPEQLASYVATMEPDDAADVVGGLASEHAEDVLAQLPTQMRRAIERLLVYPEDSAGGLMDPDVVRVHDWQTVNEALNTIRSYVYRVGMDDFFSVFVLDKDDRLVGVVPNWHLLIAQPGQLIGDIMETDLVSVRPETDQEEIAHLVRDHNLVTVPVVDENNRLLGRVTVDDVVDVIQEEYEEDLGRMAGTGAEEVRQISIAQSLRLRAPWLLVALSGQFVSTTIMRSQADFLRSMVQLTFFIPLIAAMAGNMGLQSSTLVIRGLATGELGVTDFWSRLGREIVTALAMGTLLAAILVSWGVVVMGDIRLGLAVAIATSAAVLLAACVGTAMPMLLRRIRVDPALATGPFLTTLNDIMGIVVYLSVAYLMFT